MTSLVLQFLSVCTWVYMYTSHKCRLIDKCSYTEWGKNFPCMLSSTVSPLFSWSFVGLCPVYPCLSCMGTQRSGCVCMCLYFLYLCGFVAKLIQPLNSHFHVGILQHSPIQIVQKWFGQQIVMLLFGVQGLFY